MMFLQHFRSIYSNRFLLLILEENLHLALNEGKVVLDSLEYFVGRNIALFVFMLISVVLAAVLNGRSVSGLQGSLLFVEVARYVDFAGRRIDLVPQRNTVYGLLVLFHSSHW